MVFPQHGGYAPQHGSHRYPNYPTPGGAAVVAAAYKAHHLAHTAVVYASYGHYGGHHGKLNLLLQFGLSRFRRSDCVGVLVDK
nr:hypothetical protein [Tanacetum cinerariifolium]